MKVLVVDDEYYARKALIKIISEWDDSVQIIGDVENGQEALDIVHAELPDIVFSDIRMPEIDGIELAKAVREEYPSLSVVIISGYADFQYAQSAINYQVRQYLLKPVKKAEVFSLLDDFKEQLGKKAEASENDKIMQERIESSEILFIEKRLNSTIYGSEQVDTAVFEQLLSCSPTDLPFFTMVIQGSAGMNGNLKKYLEENTKARDDGVITFLSSKYMNELIMIKFCKSGENAGNTGDRIKFIQILYELILEASARFECQLSAGMSLLHGNPGELPDAYREAAYALDYRLIDGWERIYEYKAINGKQKYGSLFDSDMEKLLHANLYNGNADWIKSYIRKLFSGIKNNPDLSIAAIQDMSSVIVLALNHVLKDINEAEDMQKPHHYVEKIELHSFLFLNDLLEWLLLQVDRVCFFVVESKRSLDPSIIEDLKKFIQDNYSYDISLEGLAKHRYFVNSSYLSRLFKSGTGRSFTSYLTEIRMNKAKELIDNQSLGMSDIAGLVGYYDLSYFIKSFKGFFGVTPGQYKTEFVKKPRGI